MLTKHKVVGTCPIGSTNARNPSDSGAWALVVERPWSMSARGAPPARRNARPREVGVLNDEELAATKVELLVHMGRWSRSSATREWPLRRCGAYRPGRNAKGQTGRRSAPGSGTTYRTDPGH